MAQPSLKRKRHPCKVDIDYPLTKVFKKQAFRPLQREIITAALRGEDIFVQAATSFGKSLCFQLPAWCSKGVTVVISPLLALVQNQVDAANSLGITTHSINSNTNPTERKTIEADLQCGHPYTRLLYVTPELCMTDNFRKILRRLHQQGQLIRVAVDEAHCISEWGHDFRTAYKELKWLKSNLQCPSVPIMALTATATSPVRKDIYKYLKLKEDQTLFFSTSTARPNIHYEVQYFSESNPRDSSGDDYYSYLLAWLGSMHSRRILMQKHIQTQAQPPDTLASNVPRISGIIYVNTRNLSESLAIRLQSSSISAQAFHAGLASHQRHEIQAQFIQASTASPVTDTKNPLSIDPDHEDISASFNIIVATTAFGMGIDIPTVRFVVHYNVPRNLESFVQESGRAGRDGKAAQSLILYTREDRDRAIYRVKTDIQKEAGARQRRQAAQQAGGVDALMPTANAQLNSQFDVPATQTQVPALRKLESLQSAIAFCENVSACRHKLISEYFGGPESSGAAVAQGAARSVSLASVAASVCDFACDVCKEGGVGVRRRRDRGLASDEEASQFTQRHGWNDNYD